ncbi:DUF226 domain-containing protein [Candidatus Borreliella tachyglossi]|uniref:DUF226 domain-containing protein n=1 Tax=Candidatus Borreliella tachyglossi TaxID=1964448 RepID=UPI0040410B99
MISVLEDKLQQKKTELILKTLNKPNDTTELKKPIKNKRKKPNIFSKIEQDGDRKLYYTKMFISLATFGVNNKERNKFYISLKNWVGLNQINSFNLFSLKEGNKFKGIFYGFKKSKGGFKINYEDYITKELKSIRTFKAYHIEFRFKTGSVFCRINELSFLIHKEKIEKKYCNTLLEVFTILEKEVYAFYNKKLPEGGIISKWREKNLK